VQTQGGRESSRRRCGFRRTRGNARGGASQGSSHIELTVHIFYLECSEGVETGLVELWRPQVEVAGTAVGWRGTKGGHGGNAGDGSKGGNGGSFGTGQRNLQYLASAAVDTYAARKHNLRRVGEHGTWTGRRCERWNGPITRHT
jgi:hypothetical protein